ncbi:MAG: hypothetical protein GXO56_05095 [Chloroflexi bacterium]|nr:hypothetical protein [Chloroflexota bacterium]
MKIRYNKTIAILELTFGVILLLMGLLTLFTGKVVVSTFVVGLFSLFYGIAMLKQTYFEVHDDHIDLFSMLGAKRTYEFTSLRDIEIEKNKVYLKTAEGKNKRIPVVKWMSRKEDWEAFVQKVQAAHA